MEDENVDHPIVDLYEKWLKNGKAALGQHFNRGSSEVEEQELKGIETEVEKNNK